MHGLKDFTDCKVSLSLFIICSSLYMTNMVMCLVTLDPFIASIFSCLHVTFFYLSGIFYVAVIHCHTDFYWPWSVLQSCWFHNDFPSFQMFFAIILPFSWLYLHIWAQNLLVSGKTGVRREVCLWRNESTLWQTYKMKVLLLQLPSFWLVIVN